MRIPDFLFVGFQKSGTTTMFDILGQHRQIALCQDVKEPMYYRVEGMRNAFGKKYYLKRYYGHVADDNPKVVGEVNAGLTFTGSAKLICKDYAPDVKILYMVREPADRAYSAYKYFMARGFLPAEDVYFDKKHGHAAGFDHYAHKILGHEKTCDQVMKKRLKYLVFSQSNYADCLKEYYENFPQARIKPIIFEEFTADIRESCKDIYDFLGVDWQEDIAYDVPSNDRKECARNAFAVKIVQILKGLRYGLFEFGYMTHWAPHIALGYQILYKFVRKLCIVPDKDNSKMLPETREYLEKYFCPQVRKLEQMTGKNLKEVWGY